MLLALPMNIIERSIHLPPSLSLSLSHRLQGICQRWERSRGPIGTQWAWLRHQITEMNRQLSQLDSAVQSKPKREQFVFSPATMTPARPLNHPAPLWGTGSERSKVVNGTSHASSVPHLLIPDGILNGPIQVRVSFRYRNLAGNVLHYKWQLLLFTAKFLMLGVRDV